ncbi:putative Melatonin receptor type 1C [Hypsibius exemplaris]|uniref:Melatonin receptor type 1C n=1 Tax=Hypsibius exemplaris TaxID=2072580 RepID=A0A9X6RJI4_HYPEX|nr:putative Melatonin receptor type 1C [Hypsibius exemplaris]
MDTLNHTGNAFIVNLAIADLCVTAFAQPANIIGALFGGQYFLDHPIYCGFVSTLCATGCLASCWNLCMIAVNRFVLICHWEHYEKIYTRRNTVIICLAVWVVIYLIELPNHVGWGDLRFSDLFFVCTFANHVHSYALFYVLVGVFTPLSVSFFCYLKIYLKVKDSRLTRNRILKGGSESDDNARQRHDTVPDTSRPNSMTRKFYEDLKIIKVLFRVLIIYVLMWLPLVILILIHIANDIGYTWYILVLLCAHGNSAVNCVIYAATIKEFRDGYRRLLGFHRLCRPSPSTGRGQNPCTQKALKGALRGKKLDTEKYGDNLGSQAGRSDGQFDATNQPNWLPAAIILPLAAAIALTIAVVCMLTRASRLFRGRKTVLVTDRAMLSNLHSVNNLAYVGVGPEHQLQQGTLNGGKSNPAFDGSTSAVDREGLSKL